MELTKDAIVNMMPPTCMEELLVKKMPFHIFVENYSRNLSFTVNYVTITVITSP
jgi:hypothetical protein